jgi:hypothetical protein
MYKNILKHASVTTLINLRHRELIESIPADIEKYLRDCNADQLFDLQENVEDRHYQLNGSLLTTKLYEHRMSPYVITR